MFPWGHLGGILGYLGPFWGQLWDILRYLGPSWGDLGGILGAFGASWQGLGHLLEATLKHVSSFAKIFKNVTKTIDFLLFLKSVRAQNEAKLAYFGHLGGILEVS